MISRRKRPTKKPKTLSPRELERRRQQRLLGIPALLYDRRQTAHALRCSVATVIRLEGSGALDPVKLNKPTGKTHYSTEQVHALARSGGGDAR